MVGGHPKKTAMQAGELKLLMREREKRKKYYGKERKGKREMGVGGERDRKKNQKKEKSNWVA